MKEEIYTIPITEVFALECECPVCVLEKKLEDEYIVYFLGASLMEPDCRMLTNDKGFCRRHIELLYSKQENKLGLGLTIDTHLQEQTGKLKKMYSSQVNKNKKTASASIFKKLTRKIFSKPNEASAIINEMLKFLTDLENKCAVCGKLDYTMDRYMDVILYLWSKEEDFRKIFSSKKGFCMRHFRQLLESTKKYMDAGNSAVFTEHLIQMQIINLERIHQDVDWFTKKFDYRNSDAPWGSSKDALPRSIQKLAGFCDLK